MRALSRLGADAVEQRHRRHVERLLQRAAHRHRALEGQIEILRRIGAEAHRAVLDQRFRMRDAVLEGEPVDERLQRRAGRAQRVGHVDLAGAALVEIIGRRRPAPAPRRWRCRRRGSRPTGWRRARAPARAPGLRGFFCNAASMVSRWTLLLRQRLRPPDRRRAARAPASAAVRPRRSPAWRTRPRRPGSSPALAMRSSTRSRAARAALAERSGRRASGDCGSATSSAASPSESFFGSLPK